MKRADVGRGPLVQWRKGAVAQFWEGAPIAIQLATVLPFPQPNTPLHTGAGTTFTAEGATTLATGVKVCGPR